MAVPAVQELPNAPANTTPSAQSLPYDPNNPPTTTNLSTGTSQEQQALFGTAAGSNPFGSIGGTGSTLSSGVGPLAPGTAESPYTFTERLAGQSVVLGQQMGALFGLPGGTGQSVKTVVSKFYDLPYQQQITLETYMWNAGFYVDSNGDALQTRPVFGSTDPSNVNALANALLQAYNANQAADPKKGSLSSLTAALISSGAGAAQRQTAPSPILGGGNTYQNLVTNPTDLYSQLYSTFESTLGRAPRQGELDNFVQVFQEQQSGAQQAANTQAEAASVGKFGQQEQARNAQMAYERTPAVAGAGPGAFGPVPYAGSVGVGLPDLRRVQGHGQQHSLLAVGDQPDRGLAERPVQPQPVGVGVAGSWARPDRVRAGGAERSRQLPELGAGHAANPRRSAQFPQHNLGTDSRQRLQPGQGAGRQPAGRPVQVVQRQDQVLTEGHGGATQRG